MHKLPRARLRAALCGLSLTPSVDVFLRRLDRYRDFSHSIRSHTGAVSTFVGPDLSLLDAVYQTDELPLLATDLSARIGQNIEIPHLQTGGPKIAFEDLRPASRALLLDHTAEEYAFMKGLYIPPSPAAPLATRAFAPLTEAMRKTDRALNYDRQSVPWPELGFTLGAVYLKYP